MTAFTAQEETGRNDVSAPVVRFDTAHPFAHRDMLDRRGRIVDKVRLHRQPTQGMALTHALNDLEEAWPRYREAFSKDEQ